MTRRTIALIAVAAIIVGGSTFILQQKPRPFTDLAPNGHHFTAPTYNAVVNETGGRNVNHVFEYGVYQGNVWEPAGRVYAWSGGK